MRVSRILIIALMFLQATSASADDAKARHFEFHYDTRVGPVKAGDGPVHVFVPLPAESESQEILHESIEASIPGQVEREDRYGNRFWHGVLEAPAGQVIDVSMRVEVKRRVLHRPTPAQAGPLDARPRARFARFLGANERVVVDHEILTPIRKEVAARAGSDEPSKLSRAIYDWVVENVEYKKVGSGWGNGDTFWACNERYGNCTDFHALFISLARSEDIPARFEIGFPIPQDRPAGEIGGYHCWVQFYLPESGWFPIDASEAFKHPEKRELFYGTQPADRIHFTTGRDLRLGEHHRGEALNYFVYPYVEVGGEAYAGEVEKRFRYREVTLEAAR